MTTTIVRTLLALSLLTLVLAPASLATDPGVTEAENQTHVFERSGSSEGGLAPLFSSPGLFSLESCSGSCSCSTCECTGTLSCCAGGCVSCWDYRDGQGLCGAAQ